jgi:hypothetical protein
MSVVNNAKQRKLNVKIVNMQLPRRVPWATVAELDQLCLWVYSGDVHDSSRNLAIERVRIARPHRTFERPKVCLT